MQKKILTIIEIIAIIIAAILIIIFKAIPEYKKTQGSSDTFININSYEDIVEIKINNSPNFALVTTKEKVTNILFFDEDSICLYNKDIENNKIDNAIKKIVGLLINTNYLKNNDNITILSYNNKTYTTIKNSLMTNLDNADIHINLIEGKTSLEQKAKELQIEYDDGNILRIVELYSKQLASSNSDTIYNNKSQSTSINENTFKKYSDNIYNKIEKYASANNISNQEINSTNLPINLIPANEEGTYYPNEESWYYIESNKVYAYIKFIENNTSYEYCYKGSIDEYIKGKC